MIAIANIKNFFKVSGFMLLIVFLIILTLMGCGFERLGKDIQLLTDWIANKIEL